MENNKNETAGTTESKGSSQSNEINSLPIFIGCEHQQIINKIDEFVDKLLNSNPEEKIKYELAVMSKDVFDKSMEVWYMTKLDKRQLEKLTQAKQDENMCKQSLAYATDFSKFMKEPFAPKYFKERLAKYRKHVLSNKQIDELLGLMLGYGHLINTTPECKAHHLCLYEFALSKADRLYSFQISRNQLLGEAENIQNQLSVVDDEIRRIQDKPLEEKEELNVNGVEYKNLEDLMEKTRGHDELVSRDYHKDSYSQRQLKEQEAVIDIRGTTLTQEIWDEGLESALNKEGQYEKEMLEAANVVDTDNIKGKYIPSEIFEEGGELYDLGVKEITDKDVYETIEEDNQHTGFQQEERMSSKEKKQFFENIKRTLPDGTKLEEDKIDKTLDDELNPENTEDIAKEVKRLNEEIKKEEEQKESKGLVLNLTEAPFIQPPPFSVVEMGSGNYIEQPKKRKAVKKTKTVEAISEDGDLLYTTEHLNDRVEPIKEKDANNTKAAKRSRKNTPKHTDEQ